MFKRLIYLPINTIDSDWERQLKIVQNCTIYDGDSTYPGEENVFENAMGIICQLYSTK